MKIKFHILILVSILSNSVFSQDLLKNEHLITFEFGVGHNDIKEHTSWKEYPKSNPGIVLGVDYSHQMKGSLLRLATGLRYQTKGNWNTSNSLSVKTNNIIIPFNLEFNLLDKKMIGFYLKVGTGLELNLSNSNLEFFIPERVFFNHRIGIGATLFNTSKKRIGLQLTRTISSNSYVYKRSSPGGYSYDEEYKYIGLEMTIKIIYKIE